MSNNPIINKTYDLGRFNIPAASRGVISRITSLFFDHPGKFGDWVESVLFLKQCGYTVKDLMSSEQNYFYALCNEYHMAQTGQRPFFDDELLKIADAALKLTYGVNPFYSSPQGAPEKTEPLPLIDKIITAFRSSPGYICGWAGENDHRLSSREMALCGELLKEWQQAPIANTSLVIIKAMTNLGYENHRVCQEAKAKLSGSPIAGYCETMKYLGCDSHAEMTELCNPKPVKPPEPVSRFKLLEL